MYKIFFSLLVLLFSVKPVHSISLNCDDPNMVFCMDMAEGSGLYTRDGSTIGATGILNGGPAWVNASATNIDFSRLTPGGDRVDYASYTYTLPPAHFLQLPYASRIVRR